MKRLNHRTRAVILATLLFILLIAIYACGILIPEDAVTGSFLNAKQPPQFGASFRYRCIGPRAASSHTEGVIGQRYRRPGGLRHQRCGCCIGRHRGSYRVQTSGCLDQLGHRPCDGCPPYDPDHSDLLRFWSWTKGAADWYCRNALVQPCQTDSGRGSATALPAICCGLPQAGKVQRMDLDQSPAASFDSSVLCRARLDVPSRDPT